MSDSGLISFTVGKQVPEFLLRALKRQRGDRAFCSVGDSGTDIFLVGLNFSDKEIAEVSGELEVIFQDYEVPFLVLKYKNISFDIPLRGIEGEPLGGNALRIYLIEENGYILKNMRLLGLNDEITDLVRKGASFTDKMDEASMNQIVLSRIYPKHSPREMTEGGVRQLFTLKTERNPNE